MQMANRETRARPQLRSVSVHDQLRQRGQRLQEQAERRRPDKADGEGNRRRARALVVRLEGHPQERR